MNWVDPEQAEVWLQQWRAASMFYSAERPAFDRAPGDDVPLALQDQELAAPEAESRALLEVVMAELSGVPQDLEQVSWAWGAVQRSSRHLLQSLSALQSVLARDALVDPLQAHLAVNRIIAAAMLGMQDHLEAESRVDPLTGVGNRRTFSEELRRMIAVAKRQGAEATVVAIDLDGLKHLNDTEGHVAGDAALIALVTGLSSVLRSQDATYRTGGDEFVILLPFTPVSSAQALMSRVEHLEGTPKFSWGAAGYPRTAKAPDALLAAADLDLYARKKARRTGSEAHFPAGGQPWRHRQATHERAPERAPQVLGSLANCDYERAERDRPEAGSSAQISFSARAIRELFGGNEEMELLLARIGDDDLEQVADDLLGLEAAHPLWEAYQALAREIVRAAAWVQDLGKVVGQAC
ncbi:MAG: GGDEF domain-containing protein [Acidimicrobiales bacterium]|jgi:diguanylate cyclase (GGDEF)-like protein